MSSTATTHNKHQLTALAALLSMIGPFTIDAYLPSFPDIETTFNVTRAILTQSLAVYLIAFALSTLLWGPLADRFGRRSIILSSLLIYIIASIGCAITQNFDDFLWMRTLQGFAASGGFIASRAMIRDANDTKNAHRAMSHVMLIFAIAPAIAPVLGGWLQDHYGWRSIFWFLTFFGILLFIITLFLNETLSKDKRQSIHPKSVINTYSQLFSHKQFISLALSLSFVFAGLFLYIAGAPTVIYDFLTLTSRDFGFLFIPLVCGLMGGAYISGKLSHRWPMTRTIMVGFSIMIISILINIFQTIFLQVSIFNLITPIVIYVFGLAMVMPPLTILALDYFPNNLGAASSMQGFLQMFINALVASIAVPLLHVSSQHFVFGQFCFLLMGFILWRYSKHQTKS